MGLHFDFSGVEPGGFREGVELFCRGGVGGTVGDFVAVGNGD